MGRATLIGLLVLAFLAPDAAGDTIPLDTEFPLRVAEAGKIGDAGLSVVFVGVVHDSRCPLSVMCVWEGVAELTVAAEAPGFPRESLTLWTFSSLAHEFPHERVFGPYRIRVVTLDPYPVTPGSIDPGVYIVTLVVEPHGGVPTSASTWSTMKAIYRD